MTRLLLLGLVACSTLPAAEPAPCEWQEPVHVGNTLEPTLIEASGLAASRVHEGVFYAHNDSGTEPELFAFRLDGTSLARWTVADAVNLDWEDLAAAPCPKRRSEACLYVADTGSARGGKPPRIIVLKEPPSLDSTAPLVPLLSVEFSFDEGPRDVEALFVGHEGSVFLIEKNGEGQHRGVWSVALEDDTPVAKRVATLEFAESSETLVTAADLHPTRSALLVRTYFSVHLFEGDTLDEALGARGVLMPQMNGRSTGFEYQSEAIAWTRDGLSFVTMSEGLNAPINLWACETP